MVYYLQRGKAGFDTCVYKDSLYGPQLINVSLQNQFHPHSSDSVHRRHGARLKVYIALLHLWKISSELVQSPRRGMRDSRRFS
jgi:hypothetical protein